MQDANDFNNDSIDKLRGLTLDNKCVAIGEIGLDYYWEPYDEIKQKECFISQIELAGECNLPICVHSRNSTADMIKVLKENKEKLTNGGVIHCFSGSVETAREFLNLGLYISFAGPITFKNAKKLPDVVKEMPLDRFLLETDAPYLAPVPFRGKTNEPALIAYVLAEIAQLKEVPIQELEKVVFNNSCKILGV